MNSRLIRASLLLLPVLLLGGCSDDNDGNGVTLSEKTQIITDIATDVIEPGYGNFEVSAAALATATATFAATPNDVNLAAAQAAWRAARAPWEGTEPFGFGPADVDGYDANSDSWPVNLVDLGTVMADVTTIDQTYIDNLGEDVKGFHAIEYVLFGAGGSKVAADFTARELVYLEEATANLAVQATGVHAAWDLNTGYGFELRAAGGNSAVYNTQNDALQELVQGMIDVADEVANGKLAGPLGPPVDAGLLESQFSNNTGTDIENNLEGIIRVYNGIGGRGIKTLVQALDPSVHADVNAAISAANTALGAVSGDLEAALTGNPTGVQAAIDAFLDLMTVLTDDVLPLTQE